MTVAQAIRKVKREYEEIEKFLDENQNLSEEEYWEACDKLDVLHQKERILREFL